MHLNSNLDLQEKWKHCEWSESSIYWNPKMIPVVARETHRKPFKHIFLRWCEIWTGTSNRGEKSFQTIMMTYLPNQTVNTVNTLCWRNTATYHSRQSSTKPRIWHHMTHIPLLTQAPGYLFFRDWNLKSHFSFGPAVQKDPSNTPANHLHERAWSSHQHPLGFA